MLEQMICTHREHCTDGKTCIHAKPHENIYTCKGNPIISCPPCELYTQQIDALYKPTDGKLRETVAKGLYVIARHGNQRVYDLVQNFVSDPKIREQTILLPKWEELEDTLKKIWLLQADALLPKPPASLEGIEELEEWLWDLELETTEAGEFTLSVCSIKKILAKLTQFIEAQKPKPPASLEECLLSDEEILPNLVDIYNFHETGVPSDERNVYTFENVLDYPHTKRDVEIVKENIQAQLQNPKVTAFIEQEKQKARQATLEEVKRGLEKMFIKTESVEEFPSLGNTVCHFKGKAWATKEELFKMLEDMYGNREGKGMNS